jgi:geranylgeranyl reductase family protein
MRQKYDLIVVGGGPAGSSAALAASKEGIEVLVLERKKIPGSPVQCAGFIPQMLELKLRLDKQIINQQIFTTRIFMSGKEVVETSTPGYIINRQLFDELLLKRARKSNSFIELSAKVVSIKDHLVKVLKDGQIFEYEADMIIGADGPCSIVGREIGVKNEEFVVALQWELPINPASSLEIYFDKKFIGGYGWLFPRGETANIGIGIKLLPSVNLKLIFLEFVKYLYRKGKILSMKPLRKTAGLISVGGPLETVPRKYIMLAGDAAGQIHPITGAGIANAVICGEIAGQTASESMNSSGSLESYKEQWMEVVGGQLEKAKNKRKYMDSFWFEEDLQDLIFDSWGIQL